MLTDTDRNEMRISDGLAEKARIRAERTQDRNGRIVQVFGQVTDGTLYIERLWGTANREKRAALLSEITGERVPKSRAGYNLLRQELARVSQAPDECIRVVEDHITAWAKAIAAG